jgi:LacI family transcriptional regulator, repressor for deo operon, udp, cdd, tsx, nupC, and nupG
VTQRTRGTYVPPSIFDVARAAGVSPSTVSRSLRGLPNVAPRTRARVEAAARELSYVASPAASGLASGRTSTVGVVLPFASRWYFMRAVEGIEAELDVAGYDLLIYNLGDPGRRERFFERLPLNRKVDGVLLIDVSLHPDEQARLQALRIPVTLVGGEALGVGQVGIDDAAAVRMALRHLANLGHRQVGMIGGYQDPAYTMSEPGLRLRSFSAGVADAGLESRDAWVHLDDWGIEGGARAAERLLAGPSLPTALFADSDETAFGVLRTLRLAGLHVPGKMSVIGIDDHPMASVLDLTTVAQPVHEIGRAAASLLLESLDGIGDPFARVEFPTQLRVRGSTAPPPAL